MNIQARVKKLENQIRPDEIGFANVILICFVFPGEALKPMTQEMKEEVRAEIIQKNLENPSAPCHLIYLPEGYEAPYNNAECIEIVKFSRNWTQDNN